MSPAKLSIRVVIFLFLASFGVESKAQTVFTPYDDAQAVLARLAEIAPPELRDATPSEQPELWSEWARKRDSQIRSRLAQGNADSIVNLLLFGTTFTDAPRITAAELPTLATGAGGTIKFSEGGVWQKLVEKRVRDLARGIAAPGTNERLKFARDTLEAADIKVAEPRGEDNIRAYLLGSLQRVLQEQASFRQALEAAKSLRDPTEQFAERSKLYKERGLSLDTSLPPDYALEVALIAMKSRGVLKPGSIKRVGIIGPGLDFTDKQEGFDFYPTQTVQPFAVMDSLFRLGLAVPAGLEVDALDLSPRVLTHVKQAVQFAKNGRGYSIELPRDISRGWTPELINYWKRFGHEIGTPVRPRPIPGSLRGVELRAVRVRPSLVQKMRAFDLDIVLQRVNFAEAEKFDLLIATNILVYYNTFEQSLALTNIGAMLKPGGCLLTNDLLLELPESPMKSGDYVSAEYSKKQTDGDHIVWYVRK